VIALLAAVAADDDIERVNRAATACDRPAMSRAWEAEVKRHGDFIVTALGEQASIAADRQALVERRRKSRGTGPAESETVLSAVAAELDDRQRALDDRKRLDTMRQEAMGWFRQQYLARCNGREL
jgi:hypothetical protein